MSEVQAAPAAEQPQTPATQAPSEAAPAAAPQQQAETQTQGQEATQQTEGEKKQDAEGEEKHRSRAYRRLDRWRQRAIEAETREKVLREQYEKAPPQRQEQQQAPATDGAPTREQFGTYEEFIRADARFNAEKAARASVREEMERNRTEEQQRSRQETQAKQDRDWQERIDAARDDIDDFDDVMQESSAPLTEAMRAAILESGDKGPFIGYHLAKNPEEAKRISLLSPTRQAAEIVKLEEKVTKPAKSPSKAPAPINTVGKATDAATHLDTTKPDAAKHLSTAEWIKRDTERMLKQGVRG